MVFGQSALGEHRLGEGEEPPERGERAEELAEKRGGDVIEHPTPAEAFGAGLKLAGSQPAPSDEDAPIPWDLVVNRRGGFATVSGEEMLMQCLAFVYSRRISPVQTLPVPKALQAETEYDLARVGERVAGVQAVTDATFEVAGVNALRVALEIVADSGRTYDVVTPVEPAGDRSGGN